MAAQHVAYRGVAFAAQDGAHNERHPLLQAHGTELADGDGCFLHRLTFETETTPNPHSSCPVYNTIHRYDIVRLSLCKYKLC